MTRLLRATWILPITLTLLNFCLAELNVVYEFNYIDYVWKNDEQKALAIATGEYDRGKIIPTDFQPLRDGRVLVTTPRHFNNPASLSTITKETGDGGPLLEPYPDWSWHTPGNCSAITTVCRIFLDDCNRLWAVDSGKIEDEQVCPPKIVLFDADTDELIRQIEIPSDLSHSPFDVSRGHVEIQAVETSADSCDKFWVYISDLEGYGMLIWDGSDIWRLDDELFVPTEEASTFTIAGETVVLREGPEGVLITPPGFLEQPYLIWKTLSSYKTYAVTLEDLHNSKSGRGITHYQSDFTAPSQEPGKVFTKSGGILFASFTTQMAIACWNLQDPLRHEHVTVLEQNDTTLQYVSSIKTSLGPEDGAETLWVMSNRRHKFLLNNMDFAEVNFRIMAVDVATYVEGTVCEPKNYDIAKSIVNKDFFHYKTT